LAAPFFMYACFILFFGSPNETEKAELYINRLLKNHNFSTNIAK